MTPGPSHRRREPRCRFSPSDFSRQGECVTSSYVHGAVFVLTCSQWDRPTLIPSPGTDRPLLPRRSPFRDVPDFGRNFVHRSPTSTQNPRPQLRISPLPMGSPTNGSGLRYKRRTSVPTFRKPSEHTRTRETLDPPWSFEPLAPVYRVQYTTFDRLSPLVRSQSIEPEPPVPLFW